jgi:hypothetical protein
LLSLVRCIPKFVEGPSLNRTGFGHQVLVQHKPSKLLVLIALPEDLVATLVVLEHLNDKHVKVGLQTLFVEDLFELVDAL